MGYRNDTTTVARSLAGLPVRHLRVPGDHRSLRSHLRMEAAADAERCRRQHHRDQGNVPGSSPLPGSAGDIYRVTGDASELDDYFVIWDAATSNWIETADPRVANNFDYNVMPHALIRESDGTFTFQEVEWEPRKVGDDIVVTAPEFVTHTISDIVFHRNRITILADETVTLSQSGDYFNFWPDKATDVLDSDPISRIASVPRSTLCDGPCRSGGLSS